MDPRIFIHLSDTIGTAQSLAALRTAVELVRVAPMHAIERRALEQSIELRQAQLRAGDAGIPFPLIPPRAD